MPGKPISSVIIFLLLLSVGICAFKSSDNKQQSTVYHVWVPPYPAIDSNAAPFIPPGQTFTTVITNNSSHPVSLYPYVNRKGMEHIAWGDSFLLAYLHAQIAGITDTDAIRLKLVQVVGTKIEKTDLFSHGQAIFAQSDKFLCSSQNSLMGALQGAYHKQCAGFIKNGIALLIKTGYFNYDNILMVHLVSHTAGTFLYKGNWAFFDFDPQEPFFMIADSANKNGYASAFDIQKNPALVTETQRYYYVNDAGKKTNLCPRQTLERYQARFTSVQYGTIPFPSEPLNIPGIIDLPPGSSMTSSYRTPYILDPVNYQKLTASFGTGLLNTCSTLSHILGISQDSASTLINNAGISIDYCTKNWQLDFMNITPTLQIILPATRDTLKTNTQPGFAIADISFPGYILHSTTNISPDIFIAGESPPLWSEPAKVTQLPQVADNWVHYLAEPNMYIPPHPNKDDTISVSFNPAVLNFAEGFKFEYLSKTDSLNVEVFKNDTLVSRQSTYAIKKMHAKK